MINYAIYARSALGNPEGRDALKRQIQESKRLADRQGLKVVAVIQERGHAGDIQRPKFELLIDLIEFGQVSGIISQETSRLVRGGDSNLRLMALANDGRLQEIRWTGGGGWNGTRNPFQEKNLT